jgi:hypothetical protein
LGLPVIRAEKDPDFINRIVNSPAVRPFVDYSGTEGPVDLSPCVGRMTTTGIVWLSNGEDALAAFPQTGDREYQAHLFFDETCRGRKALDAANEMLNWLSPYADTVWGAIPVNAPRTLWFASALGFEREGTEEFEEGDVILVRKAFH